jgi:putative transposase
MSRKYKILNQEALYFVTFTVIQWIDVFIRKDYRDIFIESLKFCQQKKGLELYAYCIMSSHIHMILGTEGKQKLEDIIRDLKKFTATKIIHNIKNNSFESRKEWLIEMMENAGSKNKNNIRYQFWQQHNQPIELSDNQSIDNTLEYIHNNPVESGFVLSPEEYLYSSAKNYAGLTENLIEVKFIE